MLKNQRLLENLHLPLWIVKDTCWMLQLKWLGVLMVGPTIVMAIYIAYTSRKSAMRLWPNLSVLCWICANSTWMLGEFFHFTFRIPSFALFIAGLVTIGVYLFKYMRQHRAFT
jgi:hypothetical protein